MKNGKISRATFRFIKALLYKFYPKIELVGYDNVPDEPCIIIGNHAQIHGPIACELYLSNDCYTWCASQMMELKEVPAYAYQDFWSQKPATLRPFFKLAAYAIAPLSVAIFNNARTIAVHRDKHIMSTFKESIHKLQDDKKVVIFPEYDKIYNNIIYDFLEGFVDIARLYYKRSGKDISFVPMYVSPKLKKLYFGKPVKFNHEAPAEDEHNRIVDYLKNEITDIACRLPEHTVVPYRNIPKKLYPSNKEKESAN